VSEKIARMSFISRMSVKPEKEAEFIRLAKLLTEQVNASEPDTLIYQFFRLREPHRFAVVESFTSEEAEHAHQNTAHFNEIAPGLVDCLDGPYVREYLDPLDP
jgi:quinol monooxygenase YgiN